MNLIIYRLKILHNYLSQLTFAPYSEFKNKPYYSTVTLQGRGS